MSKYYYNKKFLTYHYHDTFIYTVTYDFGHIHPYEE